jgi:hypothetical protein
VGKKEKFRRNAAARAEIAALRDDELHTLSLSLQRQIQEMSVPITALKTRLNFVNEERRARRAGRDQFAISDHAVVRYLERRKGMDMESVRDEILHLALRAVGDGHRRHASESGLTFAMDKNSLIVATVLTENEINQLNPD